MNLIYDAWLPIRRKSGEESRIRPWEVTTGYSDDPIVALAAPRPDFNGALIQFLIGLLQTTCAPESSRAWRIWLREPPSPEELRAKFQLMASAFELDGDGPRFMQDLTLKLEDVKKSKRKQPKADEAIEDEEGQLSIDRLLIDAPGQNTREKNRDHFVKRGHITQVCPYCAAAALFTLQTNAPGGGQGHRAGLRGGGPLTTVILGQTLWETSWFNVLEMSKFFPHSGNPQKSKDEDKFPWLGTTHTSEKGSKTERTTPVDVHPTQNFWAMPRRIRLISMSDDKTDACDLCGSRSNIVYRTYITKNYGVNYEGAWQHPLAPYDLDNLGQPKPTHPQSGGIGYRHWLGLVENTANNKRMVARVIEQYRLLKREDAGLWAFGYEMDKRQIMKARCWHDAELPIIFASEDIEVEYKMWIESMIGAAQQVAVEVRRQVKKALFRRPDEVKGDFTYLDEGFWHETEAAFYYCLRSLRDALNTGEDVTPLLWEWYTTLTRTARRMFDDASQSGDFNAANPRRIALAWNALNKALARRKLRELLGLTA